MKALTITFTAVFIIAAILFCATIYSEGGLDTSAEAADTSLIINLGDGETHEIMEDFSRVKIGTVFGNMIIGLSDNENAVINYSDNVDNAKFSVGVKNDTLYIDQDINFKFSFFKFWEKKRANIEIFLPKKILDELVIDTTSGTIDCSGIDTEKFKFYATSGTANFDIKARNVDVEITSGTVNLGSGEANYVEKLNLEATSGKIYVKNFTPKNYIVDLTSGNIYLENLAGKGRLYSTSGNIHLSYDKWDDSLDIELTSGTYKISLPSGSGLDLDNDRTSGNVSYDLDGESKSGLKNGSYSVGGDNKQQVKIEITSGNVEFFNN